MLASRRNSSARGGCAAGCPERSSALIITLAFVAIFTGIVMAFFSRAILDQQISTSSANSTKIDLFARGEADSVVGDLRQEIQAGSTITNVTAGSTNVTVFIPATATFSPSYVGTASTLTNNLVKVSAYNQPFYPNAAPYAGTPPNRAANLSSTNTSANGRTVTLATWNESYLLPKASPNSSTDATPIAGFIPPSWILVRRDGTNNPTAWSSLLSVTNADPVVGRYAYCIYDEGGLLDVNAAGYPAAITNQAPTPVPPGTLVNQTVYKASQSYADLTVIGLTPTEISALVGWRNYATLQPTGSLTNYAFPAVASSNYFNLVLQEGTGFLKPANNNPYNSQSDRIFSSRQELIAFLMQGVAQSSNERASLQNALQYLTTFSRGLNQPSFTPDAGRPTIVSLSQLGNTTAGNNSYGQDNTINPSFLTTLATNSFLRNDGSQSSPGEPLVKRRFALSRLAWLTYQGPSASRNYANPSPTPGTPDYDLWLLENVYGVPASFLAQGTAANIYRYFGLSWVADSRPTGTTGCGDGQNKWFYYHQKPNPAAGSSASPITTYSAADSASILALGSVGGQNREADFAELLKAAITAGSIGKAATTGTAGTPAGYQATIDNISDYQVMQIFANIASQTSTDGYPVRILFQNGTYSDAVEFRGVKDLPYFYALREGAARVIDATPSTTNGAPVNAAQTNAPTPFYPGTGIVLQEPIVWNPHAWNPNVPLGPRPTLFRITAITAASPNQAQPSASYVLFPEGYNGVASPSNAVVSTSASGTTTPTAASLTPAGTEIDFQIPTNRLDLFREPTLLIKTNTPAGSNLTLGSQNKALSDLPAADLASGGGVTGIKILDKQQLYTNMPGGVDDRVYAGLYIGRFPLRWTNSVGGTNYMYTSASWIYTGSTNTIVYRMQYDTNAADTTPPPPNSSSWATYDEKMGPLCAPPGTSSTALSDPTNFLYGDNMVRCLLDPRTSRFGFFLNGPYSTIFSSSAVPYYWPPFARSLSAYPGSGNYPGIYSAGWAGNPPGTYNATYLNATLRNAIWTLRPDYYSGCSGSVDFDGSTVTTSLGFYIQASGTTARPGVLVQNNPSPTATNSPYRFMPIENGGGPASGGGSINFSGAQYFCDPDGVVRRGMSAYLQPDPANSLPARQPPANAPSGNPMTIAYNFSSATPSAAPTPLADAASRPIILNRPFRSVAELGYVFSGTPWRNLDFFTPESGNAALLDVFCINDSDDPNALVAGKVNLNTRQPLVLQALLSGAYLDELSQTNAIASTIGPAAASVIANALVTRTEDVTGALGAGSGPFQNPAHLVGRYIQTVNGGLGGIDGGKSYAGFSGMATVATGASYAAKPPNLSYLLAQDASASGYANANLQRYREAIIRALSANTQTRVWNLMIDLIAQNGRYPSATSAFLTGTTDNFVVDAQRHYWIHVAIDRYTGKVLDQKIEIVDP